MYFNPGTGFFFDNLGIVVNGNGGCDLRGIDVLGTADDHGDRALPVPEGDRSGQGLEHDHEDGSLAASPRPSTASRRVRFRPSRTALAFICTATAIDIDGTPFAGERVCFMTNGEGMRTFPLGTPGQTEGLNRLCVWLNAMGKARSRSSARTSAETSSSSSSTRA